MLLFLSVMLLSRSDYNETENCLLLAANLPNVAHKSKVRSNAFPPLFFFKYRNEIRQKRQETKRRARLNHSTSSASLPVVFLRAPPLCSLINSIEIQNMPRCDSSECLAGRSAHLKRNDTICGTRGSLHLRSIYVAEMRAQKCSFTVRGGG